jgi:hypothetical protein
MSVAFSDTAPRPLAASDARRWEDEIVYVVIIEKFFNGGQHSQMAVILFGERGRVVLTTVL